MFVQLICKDRSEKEIEELYQIIGAICEREGIQAEERQDTVEILVCPQGKILVTEGDRELTLTANTRHAGAGFHAFCVDIFKDIEEEQPGKYELIDDLEYASDEDFHRLHHVYENELDYIRNLILTDPDFRRKNYLYDETYYLPKAGDDEILTSRGPLSRREFQSMDLDDLMDWFYVWNDWDRDARFYRNAALTLLAKEGVGEYTVMNDATIKTANEICDYLEIAHEKDPELPLPVNTYFLLVNLLGREDRLKDCPRMKEPAVQYRQRDVYHLFADCQVVAPGAAERSFDPVTNSVNLMAPYKEEGEWSWLIQASKDDHILTGKAQVMDQEPHLEEGGMLWMDDWEEDGFQVLEAVIRKDEDYLYIHVIANDEKYMPYLKDCIRQSGFVPQS
ncbi:hypothetical protein [uncultured Faecalibaculum sp.]|uniref:hypothetical protein n=1 Tax=uncultured Faecalibaculum sp. TaxID=1729681 RepID=UPI0025D9F715|nr:hypothetical protein [uncultured Faecalibaculum sp.]